MAHPPLETFQVGWICALQIEAAAAMEMLDENFGPLDSQDTSDPNTYTLGRIGKHSIVIACLPKGQHGNTSATTVANNMVRTFSKSLRIGLIVGVGGGIPSASHDIRLGDVVISCPEGTVGGVLQYDMGKVCVNDEFCRTGFLNSPPRSLLTAVSLMRAAELRDDPRFPEYLTSAIKRNTRTRQSFGRPSAQCDRLFKLEHNHPGTASSCDGCLTEWEETRSERDNSDPQPHYGIIASGNADINNGYTRERLRLDSGGLCVEKEAAGLMMDFPCIVICGICDYADAHKNEQWQGYAALAAASYAKELLWYVPRGKVSQENLVVDVCGLKEELEGTNQRLDRAHNQREQHHNENKATNSTDKQQFCHQVFKISNYKEQKDINPRRAEGTCQWALQNTEYLRWSNSCCNDLLWVSADPGCGKSVLAKSIVDDYLQTSNSAVAICYFFFKDNNEQNDLATALCAIIHQLFRQRPYLLHHALKPWGENGEKLRQEVDELWQILITAASADASCKIVCILDALDECRESDQARLIERLKDFHRQPCSTQDTWLKFLVTSRPYDDIQDHFRTITDSFPQIHIKGEEENDQIREEIDRVVKIRVRELAQRAQLSSDIQRRLEHQLLHMENRTYLWLHLAMDDIESTFKNSFFPDEESIQLIPDSVNAAYEKILSRVSPNQVETVRKILQIIVAARRPLKTQEMAMALRIAIYPQSHAVKAPINPVDLKMKVRRLCGLFVFTNNSKIYLIHQTAKEFLISKRNEWPENTEWRQSVSLEDAHLAFSQVCMTYLVQYECQRDHGQLSKEGKARLNNGEYGEFSDYSANHWIGHLQSARNPSVELLRLAGNLCDEKQVSVWFHFARSSMMYLRDMGEPLPFFWAARWGLVDVADLLLRDSKIKITNEIMQKAAAHKSSGNTVMKLLLDRRGDEIKITDEVLQEAAANSSSGISIMELLLDRRGDEIEITDNVLQKAAANSWCGISIIKLLLDRKGDKIKITSRVLKSAAANWRDGPGIVKCLLDRGVGPRITRRVILAASTNPIHNEAIIQHLRPRSHIIKKIMRRTLVNQQYRASGAGKRDRWVGQHKFSTRGVQRGAYRYHNKLTI